MFSLFFMKAFVESYSKQLEQCTFLGMFIMDGPIFLGGRGGDWKFKEKKKQVLLLSLIEFFYVNKFLHELLPTKKNVHNRNVRNKFHAPENFQPASPMM